MRHIDILNINIHQIQMFLTVARLESITLAAEYLGVSQSMLSKNIGIIERELGLQLFIRYKRKMRLSPAGKVLEREFSKVTQIVEKALIKAHSQQAEQTKPLLIALPISTDETRYLLPAVHKLREKYGDFDYYVDFYPFNELPFVLLSGEVDVAFTAMFQQPMMERLLLNVKCVKELPLLLLMTKNNPLCLEKEVSAQCLKQQNIIALSGAIEAEYISEPEALVVQVSAVVRKQGLACSLDLLDL